MFFLFSPAKLETNLFPCLFSGLCVCVPFMFNLHSLIVLVSSGSVSGHYSALIKILILKLSGLLLMEFTDQEYEHIK